MDFYITERKNVFAQHTTALDREVSNAHLRVAAFNAKLRLPLSFKIAVRRAARRVKRKNRHGEKPITSLRIFPRGRTDKGWAVKLDIPHDQDCRAALLPHITRYVNESIGMKASARYMPDFDEKTGDKYDTISLVINGRV